MNRVAPTVLSLLLAMSIVHGGDGAKQKQFLAPDSPVDIGASTLTPYEPTEYLNFVFASRSDWTVPPPPPGENPLQLPPINALHRLENPGQWLYVVREPGFYTGQLEGTTRAATTKDVLRYDSATETRSLFFCGAEINEIARANTGIDAVYLESDDALVVSFDNATNLGVEFEQHDLARFTRTGPGCADWEVDLTKAFDGTGKVFSDEGLTGSNLVGATRVDDGIVLAFDVATILRGASEVDMFVEVGDLVRFDGSNFSPFDTLIPWNSTAFVAAVSLAPPTCTNLPDPTGDDLLQTCAETWQADGAEFMMRDRIEWKPVEGASFYNVYTIPMSDPASTPQCQTPFGVTDTQYVLETPLAPGEGLFILVSWADLFGIESDLGRQRPANLIDPDAQGPLRPNPCPCPCGASQ